MSRSAPLDALKLASCFPIAFMIEGSLEESIPPVTIRTLFTFYLQFEVQTALTCCGASCITALAFETSLFVNDEAESMQQVIELDLALNEAREPSHRDVPAALLGKPTIPRLIRY